MPNSISQAASTTTVPVSSVATAELAIDTSRGSFPHYVAGLFGRSRVVRAPALIFIAAIVVGYAVLVLGALFSRPLPLVRPTELVTLPFFRDWNIAYTFLISFPTLMTMLVTDQRILGNALRTLQQTAVLRTRESTPPTFVAKWESRFKTINVWTQIIGLIAGLVFGLVTLSAYLRFPFGFPLELDGRFLPAGYTYVYCITLFYALIIFYIVRCVAISLLLRAVTIALSVNMSPFHPDGCGGLQPVGYIGLRNQYVLTVLGLNLILLASVSVSASSHVPIAMLTSSVAAYLVFGPIVFLGPLVPFRSAMHRQKNEWMTDISQGVRLEFERIRGRLRSGTPDTADLERLQSMNEVAVAIGRLPVWPFDARTSRRFLSAYALPFGVWFLGALGEALIGKFV